MWRRSVAASARAMRVRVNAHKNLQQQRFLSAASLSPEELEILNEPREAMDYDVVLVRWSCYATSDRERLRSRQTAHNASKFGDGCFRLARDRPRWRRRSGSSSCRTRRERTSRSAWSRKARRLARILSRVRADLVETQSRRKILKRCRCVFLRRSCVEGNVFEPRALDELLPNWKELDAPIKTPVTDDAFIFLSETKSLQLPHFLLPQEQVCQSNLKQS